LSAIFGIVNRDGSPVAVEAMDWLRIETASWGRDGGSVICDGMAGMGLALSRNIPGDHPDCFPLRDSAGFIFTAAGRVDNRTDVEKDLGLGPGSSRLLGDVALIHRAWLTWGDSFPGRIYGDWAFAAWDPRARKLFLARDHSGNTALYYRVTSRFFAFSSSRRALLKLSPEPVEMDELYLAQILVSWFGYGGEQTIHKQVKRLPPAHLLTVTPDRVEARQYWRLEDTPELLLPRRSDYVSGFLDVFDRAVRDRLRSNGQVGAMLSGGLDSSSVAVTAARYLGEEGQRLSAFTSVPAFGTDAYTGRWFGDEFPFAHACANAAGNIDLEAVNAAGLSPIDSIRRALEISLEPKHSAGNMFWLLELRRIAAERGCRTLLTGYVGNAGISWTGDMFSHPLGVRVRQLGWRRWLRASVRRRLPQKMLTAVPGSSENRRWRETAIHPDFARRLDLTARYLEDPATRSPRPPLAERCYLLKPGRSFMGAAQAEMGAAAGLDIRDPTADARLLAFCFSVPDRIFIDPETGLDRWLIREAMKGRLPESIRMNRRRGRQAGDIVPRLRQAAGDVESALAEIEGGPAREYVSVPAMRSAWNKVRTEDSPAAFSVAISVLTRGVMAGLFVNGFGTKW
jgi:asparagine synthase (glutamine-hydrolysing)